MADLDPALVEKAARAVRLAIGGGYGYENAARLVLAVVVPAVRETALNEAADEMSARLDTFPQAGRHTRARWAEWFIRDLAAQQRDPATRNSAAEVRLAGQESEQ